MWKEETMCSDRHDVLAVLDRVERERESARNLAVRLEGENAKALEILEHAMENGGVVDALVDASLVLRGCEPYGDA